MRNYVHLKQGEWVPVTMKNQELGCGYCQAVYRIDFKWVKRKSKRQLMMRLYPIKA